MDVTFSARTRAKPRVDPEGRRGSQLCKRRVGVIARQGAPL